MSFWTGFAVGVVSVLVVLPLFSKVLVKLAMKRQMNNLLGSVTHAQTKFENLVKDNAKEDEDGKRKEDSSKGIGKEFKGIEFVN